MTTLWIAVAGSAGAMTRFVLDGVIRQHRNSRFPWATFVINVTGSLVLGFVTGLMVFHGAARDLGLILGVGFCGGYTTFSTAGIETVRLIQSRYYTTAAANAVGSLVVTVAAGGIGLALAAL
ncbi:fluoride efflux transporter CrcB [Nocardia paucivorans]|uniref:fluoride efflux transporter CrcB n=1 Tax=Nocardia paucivorans TaxID=114259 RepID=UPI0002EC70B8|nr:fluoride efflux transporter CrcB [Nocardia paucivorans]